VIAKHLPSQSSQEWVDFEEVPGPSAMKRGTCCVSTTLRRRLDGQAGDGLPDRQWALSEAYVMWDITSVRGEHQHEKRVDIRYFSDAPFLRPISARANEASQ
jgi:hypothetical protein